MSAVAGRSSRSIKAAAFGTLFALTLQEHGESQVRKTKTMLRPGGTQEQIIQDIR